MASLENARELRLQSVISELGLVQRVDSYSAQLMSDLDPMVFVRVEPLLSEKGAYVVTDLNHRGWTLAQEANALTICIMLLGDEPLRSLWFSNPSAVRSMKLDSAKAELEHLDLILKQLAQSWPAFIDGTATYDKERFGVRFRTVQLKS